MYCSKCHHYFDMVKFVGDWQKEGGGGSSPENLVRKVYDRVILEMTFHKG